MRPQAPHSTNNPLFEPGDRPLVLAGGQQGARPERPTAARVDAAAAAGLPHARAQAAGDQPERAARPAQRAAAARLALMRRETAHQAGMAVLNSSPVQGLASAAVSVGNTLLPPPARTAVSNARLLVAAPTPGAAQRRTDLQRALTNMGELPANATSGQRQQAQTDAHAALIAYVDSTGPVLDRWIPVMHKATLVGVAGAGMAFGVGRSSGIAVADAALRHGRNQEHARDIYAPQAPSAAPTGPATDALVNAATQAVVGAAMGGAGNFFGERVLAPFVNLMGRQSAPVDAKAVVTDEMETLMNELQPGAGTQLRQVVVAEQKRSSSPGSERNVAVGQFFFDGANAVRAGMQGSNTLGIAGTALIGTTVSTLAGASIGATMAINASLTKVSVPELDSLQAEVAMAHAGLGGSLANVAKHDVPVFFTKHRAGGGPSFSSPVSDPSGSTLATVANTATSIARRGAAMLKATTGTAVVGAMAPALVAAMPSDELKTAVRASAAAIGIHTAIKPWFESLASGIPSSDQEIVGSRRSAVDAAVARAQSRAQQAAQAAAGVVPPDLEMGLVQRTHSAP